MVAIRSIDLLVLLSSYSGIKKCSIVQTTLSCDDIGIIRMLPKKMWFTCFVCLFVGVAIKDTPTCHNQVSQWALTEVKNLCYSRVTDCILLGAMGFNDDS